MRLINNIRKINIYLVGALLIFSFAACKKLTEVSAPQTSLNAENVYSGDATAAAVLTGIYANMSSGNQSLSNFSLSNMSIYTGLSADELTLYSLNDPALFPFYSNDLTSYTPSLWSNIYSLIFQANSAIEGLNGSSGLNPAVKQQLTGEASFLRAFCFFYLTNLYGDIPLTVVSNYKTNSLLARTPKAQVYQQIINDLKNAQNLLSSSYLQSDALTAYSAGTEQKVRPTKWAATALLARVYLYTGNYVDAEAQATSIISNPIYNLCGLDSVFLMNSSETIWSLQPVGGGVNSNTGDGAIFILPPSGPNSSPNKVYLSNSVLNSFETNDMRKVKWVNSVTVGGLTYYYPYKYKIGSVDVAVAEYILILRLAEQYLIRSEARAYQNNLDGATRDLNAIRTRAGLAGATSTTQAELLVAIQHERQTELFTEWGHRWFDLKRTNNIDAVMNAVAPEKNATWSPYQALYPIPQSELKLDPKLSQNSGY